MEYVQGASSFLFGTGLLSQILFTVLALVALYAIITAVERTVDTFTRFDRLSADLVPNTTPVMQTVVQSPDAGVPLVYNSMNEKNGMEFSYSVYLYINPETFENTSNPAVCGAAGGTADVFKHVFHKGNRDVFPLMAPGLFVNGTANTLRLYMNSANKWDNFVEIPNVPVAKWFHLVVTLKGKYLDVFVNGNVTVRHEFDTVPKLNYGNIYVMQPTQFPADTDAAALCNSIKVNGAMKGMVSRLKYFAYALNYAHIDALYRERASQDIVQSSMDYSTQQPPYFWDDWWVNKY